MERVHRLAKGSCSAFVLILLLAGCLAPEPSDEQVHDPVPPDADLASLYAALAASPELRYETDHGTIRLLLYTELMPVTAGRMAELTAAGFYDGTIVHRVVDDFVIQGGDPSRTGMLGSGETVPHEVHPDLLFGAGAVGLARDVDPDSGDSQWFITERPAPHLSDPSSSSSGALFGAFALYAQVFEGMETVRAIAAVPVVPGLDRPVEEVTLEKATLHPPPTDVDLLQYPQTLRRDHGFMVQRPLHLLAGHPFTVTVFLPVDEEQDPPQKVELTYGPVDENETGVYAVVGDRFLLTPLPDDPWTFQGTAQIPAAGDWHEVLMLDGTGTAKTVQVAAWHDDYARFAGEA